MHRATTLLYALSLASVWTFAACSDDDAKRTLPGTSSATSTSGSGGTGATSGSGGQGGDGASGGGSGTGGAGGQDLCGNGAIDATEDCEGADLGGKSCQDIGYSNPAGLTCSDTCHFDFSDCAATCDGVLKEPGEECDGDTISLETCIDFGYSTPGSLGCGPTCHYDWSGCVPTCDGTVVEPGEECDGAAPPGKPCLPDCTLKFPLVINEIFYDRTGVDTGAFIELRGEPGLDLAGYSLHFVDGASGVEYAAPLDLAGTVGVSGYFVIAQDGTLPIPVDAGSVIDGRADLQDGPDNLVLSFGAEGVDAIGYGAFAAADTFVGETLPAPGVVPPADPAAPQVALARVLDGEDTNDNGADFVAQAPTPGATN